MRELTSDSALGLHALHLMVKRDKPASLNEISRSSGFGVPQVRRVLNRIRQAGMIESRPGRGFVLARPPGEINVRDLVCAIETSQAPKAPCAGDFDECASRASCILAPLCRTAELGFREAFASFTLADFRNVPVDLPNCLDPRVGAAETARRRPEAS
jgi:Rrf2 family protein